MSKHSGLVFAPNLGWGEVDLKTPLERATGLPVEIENAANACALAEIWFGEQHHGVRNLVIVTVSEGIGVGVVSNGELMRGMAGEFGHVTLDEDGPLCKCGNHGCWEVLASNRAAVRYYTQATVGAKNGRNGHNGKAQAKAQSGEPAFEDLLRLAESGDEKASEALAQMAQQMGAAWRCW
jgi:predicted NBD/HSP70 family sugar kinase